MSEQPDLPVATPRPPRFWMRRFELTIFLGGVCGLPLLAWANYLLVGLPPTGGDADPASVGPPHTFPLWVRGWHYLNLLCFALMLHSGWRMLQSNPRFSWRGDATPEMAWLVLPWHEPSANQDRAAFSGDRLAHWWGAIGWFVVGIGYLGLVFGTGQWRRIWPQSWRVLPEAWHVFVNYCTGHVPLTPDGYWRYNSLQLLSYAVVVFGFGPLAILSGLGSSTTLNRRSSIWAHLCGNRQAARSIHLIVVLGFLAFLAVHIFFVVLYACLLNLNHVVLGTDETGLPGWLIGSVGLGLIGLATVAVRRIAR